MLNTKQFVDLSYIVKKKFPDARLDVVGFHWDSEGNIIGLNADWHEHYVKIWIPDVDKPKSL